MNGIWNEYKPFFIWFYYSIHSIPYSIPFHIMSHRPPLCIFFSNFWTGFIEKTDSMNCTFFITLLEKVFKSQIHISSSPDDATILVESIFGDQS